MPRDKSQSIFDIFLCISPLDSRGWKAPDVLSLNIRVNRAVPRPNRAMDSLFRTFDQSFTLSESPRDGLGLALGPRGFLAFSYSMGSLATLHLPSHA